MKTLEEITIENENLKRGNVKVWEQLEKSTEILSHHEAYISLLEEENDKLKTENKWYSEQLNEAVKENAQLKKWCEEFNALEVAKENTQLKELLKECRKSFNKLKGDTVWYPYEVDECIAKIEEVLK